MGKQDVIDAVRGLPTSRVPWVPYVGVHAAYLIGKPADKFLRDPDLIAQGIVYAATRYKADGIPLVFDLSLEAMFMGCEHAWWPDSVPSITGHPLQDRKLSQSNIRIPGPADGRWPVVVEAGKKVKKMLGDVALYGVVCGPLTQAWNLRGICIYTDLYKERDTAQEIIDFCGRVAGESARIYAEVIGCDVIAIADPLASQMKADALRRFLARAIEPAIQTARKAGKVSSFLLCGNATTVLEEVAQVGTDGFSVDEQVSLAYARDVARTYGVGFGGNLSVSTALALGIISPREDAIASLAAGGTIGYVFSTGWDMPYDVPVEHVDQVLEAAEWFNRNYAKYPRVAGEEVRKGFGTNHGR